MYVYIELNSKVSKIFQMSYNNYFFSIINVQANWMTVAILKNKTYLKLKGLQVYSIGNELLKLQTNLMTVYQ